ncbi:OPT/YSL family transporter [Streptomyces sp. NA02950]|uniref:OPT/YSL family transporter n=1 Tax=Streptomyces sp. NA02950 TaxID=2742137 RepID=UPI001591365E|nr:OPT/YSL family transporter [Streptomyces sp. NA02950]QKV92991.1 OPT/YSL family transporter [Streptomyces sp. NA02950]
MIGCAIGTVLCVLNVLVLFKTGSSFGGSALVALLGAALLRVTRRLDWQHLFVVFSLASSGYVATAALDTGIGTVMLRTGSVPSWILLTALAVGANLCGVLLGILVARSFVFAERLPYPTLQPAVTLMNTLTQSGDEQTRSVRRVLPVTAAAGGAVALVAEMLGRSSTPALPGLPSYLVLSLSPLLVGLGMLIGPRACGWMVLGSLYTVVLWVVQQGGATTEPSYDHHLAYPWVLACGVGIILGYSLMSLVKVRGPLAHALSAASRPLFTSAARRRWTLGSLGAAAAALIVIAVVRGPSALEPVALVALGAVLVLLFSLFLNRAGGEVGIAPLAPTLYLSVTLLAALGLGSTTATLGAATICSAAVGSVYYTYSVKVADSSPAETPVPARRILWTQMTGGLIGALLGISVIVLLARLHVIGDEGFPAPVAQSLGFIDSTVRDTNGYSGTVGMALAVGGPIGIALTFVGKAMPTMLGLGILLPPAYALTIGLGGLLRSGVLRNHPGRKTGMETAASGLIIGEGVVMVIVLITRAFLN